MKALSENIILFAGLALVTVGVAMVAKWAALVTLGSLLLAGLIASRMTRRGDG
jgi:hypothetical protein